MTREPCAGCPWTPGGVKLNPGRLRELRRTVINQGGTFICHQSQAHYHDREVFGVGEDGAAVCSGWASRLPNDWPAELQIADRLGFIVLVDVPEGGRGR